MKITTYYATHALGRADMSTPDADAVIQRVNAVTGSNGDSLYRDRVQDEIDALIDAETQKLYQVSVDAVETEIEDD